MVLTHGWGCDSAMWYYAKRHWADRYRLVVWDLPGHGLSSEAKSRDYSTERLAADLRGVVEATGTDPVILVGHSLGGMTVLTFCRLFPQLLGQSVASLVLVHTTPTNPLRTMSMAALYSALQKPLIEPLLHLTIWTWPLVWCMNWLSYWNGSAHRSTSRSSFAGNETRGQLDFAARYTVQTSPAVMGRGGLGMLRYDASQILNQVRIPVRVVGGNSDPVTSPDASRWLATTMPDTSLVMLNPAKHLGFLERNFSFTEAVTGSAAKLCTPALPLDHTISH